MVDGDELHAIEEQRLFELVGNPRRTVRSWREAGLERCGRIVGVGCVARAWRQPATHLAAAKEIGDELEPLAIPRIQVWTRRGFPIELFELQHAFQDIGRRRPPVSACRIPDGQSTRTTSAPSRSPRPKRMSEGAGAGVAA